MKFTLSWLKDHLDTQASLAEIETTLSSIGLEVKGIDDPGATLSAFTLARVVDAKPHPNADRLRVVQVEIEKGKPPVEVVCGAPNARAGMIAVFAPLGTYIPGSAVTLEKKPVRGVVSNGMLVSERELQLSDEHEGIIDLPPEFASRVGERYADAMGLSDPVIEVKLTPNRPDCTGVRGIARDLAAAGLGMLKPERAIEGVEGAFPSPVAVKIDLPKDAASACSAFAGRYVKGVKNASSPAWMQRRLKAVGLRPINALVDVTNYVSLDRGRPLHVYDADKLKGAVRARLGREGESFMGLDGREHAVDETMCVIADDSGPLGLGGVIGGEASGCTDATINVLIECALFDPVRIAATGRKTGLMTDARYRFERGVDPQSVMPGLDLATRMILDTAGGEPSKAVLAGKIPDPKRTIAFDASRVAALSGLSLPNDRIKSILEALGCAVAGKGAKLKVIVPSWRPDIHGPADLVEEVVRIAGLDKIEAVPLPRESGVARPVLTPAQKRVRRARRTLAARGLVEAVTWSFIPPDQARAFGASDELTLDNPISPDLAVMRPSLPPGLLAALARNRNRGAHDAALFEIGQAYRGRRPEDQYFSAAAVRAGTATTVGAGRHWDGASRETSAFDAKADAAAVLAALKLDVSKMQITADAPSWFHPGRSGVFRLGPKNVLAAFGEIHPATLRAFDLTGPVVAAVVFLDNLPPEKAKSRAKAPFAGSDLMPVRRDFAFVVGRDVPARDVLKAAMEADKALIADASVFDVFEDAALTQSGRKSLAIEVMLQPQSATLTDKEIEAVSERIVAAVQKATGGNIRT